MHTQVVAVDTEFVRERTFYPIPGLIQLANKTQIYLIDPVAVGDLQPFLNLLENAFVTKVMHSASEDIELFYAMGCQQVKSVFDTQIAATWLGAGLSLSLANLVAFHKDVEMDKSQTRTNWLARPLSTKQLDYAAMDVKYLLEISEKQIELLNSLGFISFVNEDNEIATLEPEENHDAAYLHVRGAHSLDSDTLGKLSLLAAWRERAARRDDRPKSHVLKDQEMIKICKEVSSSNDLHKLDMHPAARRRYSKEILAVINEQAIPQDCNKVIRLQDLRNGRQLLKEVKTQFDDLAEKNGLPKEVIPSKRWLEAIIKSEYVDWYPRPKIWRGWREEMLGPQLNNLAEKMDVQLEESS